MGCEWWALGIGLWVWIFCWPQVGSKFLNSGIEIILDSCNFVTAYHEFWNQGLKIFWIQATLLLYVMMLAPSGPQVGPKLAQSWLQIGSELAPSCAQIGSKLAASLPQRAPEGPGWPRDPPRASRPPLQRHILGTPGGRQTL